MLCPKCGSKTYVVDSREENFERKRRYRCQTCTTYIHTIETIVTVHKPTEEELELFSRCKRKNE